MYKEKIDDRTVVADYLLRKALSAVQRAGVHPNDRGAVIAGYIQSVTHMLDMDFGSSVDDLVSRVKAACDQWDARRGAPK